MFCSKCGNEVTSGSFCSKCGAPVAATAQQQQPQQPPQQPNYQQPYAGGAYPPPPPPKVPTPHYAPGSFVERLHHFGGSITFLVGIILFSAGSLFNLFMSFSAASILSLALLALPVTGFWLIFAASKMPKMPEKTMPALTLFKVSIIIDLVVRCLLALVLLIGAIALFVAAAAASSSYFAGGSGALAAVGLFMLLLAGGVVVFIVLYFKSVLGLIAGIRSNIAYNAFQPLPGMKVFTILTYIGVGCAVLGTIISAASTSSMYSMLYELPSELRVVLEPAMSSLGGGAISALFSLITNAGIVVCLVVLTQFNNSLAYANQNPPQSM